MKTLFSSILIIDSIIAFYLFLSPVWQRKTLNAANKALHLYALASGIWSLGFGMLFIQTDVEKAYFWRSFAIFGTVLYMITAQYLICQFAQISPKTRRTFNFIALTGVVPYILSIQRDQTEYFMSSFGMTYRFKPGIVNILYSTYFLLVALNIVGIILYMIRTSEKKRLRSFGKHFLIISSLILIGTVLDMVFPALGLPALPGSNVTQFWGLIILFYAMNVLNRTNINVANMSEFIYYSLAMPVLVYDDSFKLRIANEAATKFLALPREPEALEKCTVSSLFTDCDNSLFDFEDEHCAQDFVCKLQMAPCNLTVSKIKDNYGDIIGYIVNVTDLSERMRYIEELKKARQEADLSNSAKSQFLANMSHEIRTPMNAIIGFSELALKENPSSLLKEYLEDIKASSHNLMSLINDILDISKIESGKMTLVNVEYRTSDLLHDVYDLIYTLASQKGLDFIMEIDSKLPSVLFGDANRLKNILVNLLNNAVKYTPAGFVKLEIRCTYPSTSPLTIEMRVIDSGIGIKEKELPRLFDVFTQFDQEKNYETEGTGLGLALVKNYCALMNGSVRVESIYGEGSTFIAVVEQTVVDAAPLDKDFILSHSLKDEFSLGTLQVQNVEVLVVDDNPINRKVISRSMSFYGMKVDVAQSGEEAIHMCTSKQYDLIFMDQMMPEMDGIEAMHRIRRIGNYYAGSEYCKIIALTANAIAGVREKLLEEGFDEYLSKPVNFRDLEAVLQNFLPESAFVKDAVEPVPNNQNSSDRTLSPSVYSEEALQEMLPEVNVKDGILHCGGTPEDYIDILEMMVEEAPEQLRTLRNHYTTESWEDFTTLIHALKGSCLNIGANSCGEKARALERAGRNRDISFISEHLEEFETAYEELLNKISAILGRDAFSTNDSTFTNNPLTMDYLTDCQKALANFDFATASSALRKAHNSSDADEFDEILCKLDGLMESLDIDGLTTILQSLTK